MDLKILISPILGCLVQWKAVPHEKSSRRNHMATHVRVELVPGNLSPHSSPELCPWLSSAVWVTRLEQRQEKLVPVKHQENKKDHQQWVDPRSWWNWESEHSLPPSSWIRTKVTVSSYNISECHKRTQEIPDRAVETLWASETQDSSIQREITPASTIFDPELGAEKSSLCKVNSDKEG